MNREQKRAWVIVSSMSLAAILCVAALVSRHFELRLATILLFGTAAVVQGAGALACLRVKPDKGPVTFGERDRLIQKNAGMAILVQYGRAENGEEP